MKQCVLEDRACTNCRECDICDLNSEKICDNCMKCINSEEDYKSVIIEKIIIDQK